jgi:hypothetical protein
MSMRLPLSISDRPGEGSADPVADVKDSLPVGRALYPRPRNRYAANPQPDAVKEVQGSAFAGAMAGLGMQLVIAGLAVTASSVHGDGSDSGPWPLSLVALSVLATAGVMVSLLWAVEPVAWERIHTGRTKSGRASVYVYRLLTVLPIAAAFILVLVFHESSITWHSAMVADAGLLVVSIEIFAFTLIEFGYAFDPTYTKLASQVENERIWFTYRQLVSDPDPKVRAIGASGGGIRAASFVLGGHQALQAAAPELGIADAEDEPHVFAVSGGSYVAASLAMVRAFEGGTGRPRETRKSWTDALGPASPEMERLRRHTRYLFEPRKRIYDGLLTLLTGALVNLFVLGVALLTLTWFSAQVAMTLGTVALDRGAGDVLLDFHVSLGHHWSQILLVPGVLLVVVVVLTLVGWFGGSRYNNPTDAMAASVRGEEVRRAGRSIAVSSTWRAPLVFLGLVWLLVTLGIPAATTGIAEMATDNQPTATLARGIAALNLATHDMCGHAFKDNVQEAVDRVNAAAAADPAVKHEATAGACGAELTVTHGAGPDGPAPSLPARTDPRWADLERYADLGDLNLGGRVAGIFALLAGVLGLLRRGPAPGEALATQGPLAALRRKFATFVPLTVTAGVALYLTLLWFRWLVSGQHGQRVELTAVLGLAAAAIAFLIDANSTSMHNFYRARLADAFSVGVRQVGGQDVARQLPADVLYRFSDLSGPVTLRTEQLLKSIDDARTRARAGFDLEARVSQHRFRQWSGGRRAARIAPNEPTTDSRALARLRQDVARIGMEVDRLVAANDWTGTDIGQPSVQGLSVDELESEMHQVESRLADIRRQAGRAGARLHIVGTLNTQAPNESPTMRGGFPIVFGAEKVQVFREGGLDVELDMRSFENFAGPGRLSIMSTVAISGAAVSPLMGRYAEQMAPYRFLLALFNIRLGTWVRNPAHTPPLALPGKRSGVLWMTTKPGLAEMALEAAGSSSARKRWVYLSDGGHLDNTGMVEAVRHCVIEAKAGRVVVLDASNDASGSWQAVGDAVAVIRADLDLDLVQQDSSGHPPWMRLYVARDNAGQPLIEVLVVKAVRVGESDDGDAPTKPVTRLIRKGDPPQAGVADAAATDWWARLPPDVQSFHRRHRDFPRASTGRQKFGDLEFEAYRALGFATVTDALRVLNWIA